ncbi:hypothetical protein HQQ94_07130 [Shewanella sp. VB17]|uniref:DUF6708 domain-containing protein n=1 Tax=Shewanella sp. VB17 TaxID=2739432 RepID=UPI0015647804|nr:DUF6708 domain-containing protein [Shewanella sp. VB17]NRD73015.1 hypothetical protein [Shewanella sp. VB17]
MSNKKTNNQSSDGLDVSNHPPTAGETRSIPLGQALFLSPLPLPTTQGGGLDINGSFLAVNEVYLDIGTSNRDKDFQVQLGTSVLSSFALFCLFLTLFVIYAEGVRDGYAHSYAEYTVMVLQDDVYPVLFGIGIGTFLLLTSTILYSTYQKSSQRPIRFNRQRREVCYFPDSSDRAVICPWESLITWIASSSGTTGSNIMTTYTFGMAIEDKEKDMYWFIRQPVINVLSAQAQWEAIRDFMEQGPQHCPAQTEHTGRHTFDEKRTELHRKFKHGPRYWFKFSQFEWSISYTGVAWFYIWNVLCWWKFPYYVAEWDLQFSMKKMPASIEAWSSTLAEDEWAKPSEELRVQTAKMETHLAAGKGFTDFFTETKAQNKSKKRA